MALQVGINSYVSLQDAAGYIADRLDTSSWSESLPVDQSRALVTATRIIDGKAFIGQLADPAQSLAWPRVNVTFNDPRAGGVVTFSPAVIPERVKRAVIEQALHLLSNEDLLNDTGATFERIKVDVIEIESSAADYMPPKIIPAIVDTLLKPLLKRAASGNMWWTAN